MNLIYTTCFLDISGVTKINYDILCRIKSSCNIHICVTERDDHLASSWDSRFVEMFGGCLKLWKMDSSIRYRYFVDYVREHRIKMVFNTHSLWLYKHAARLKRDCQELKIVDALHVLEPCRLCGGAPDISANRFVHPYLDKTILISDDLRRYLIRNYKVDAAKYVIVKNGIETARFMGRKVRNRMLREELGVSEGCMLVGFIGRFTEQKRPLLFLDVICRILAQRDDVRFYMVGDGPMAPEIKRRIARLKIAASVTLLPPRDDIPDVLDSTDLLVLTSLYEGAPLTILEALACGVPVVASDVGAISEYTRGGCDLVATDPRRSEAERLAKAVLDRLAHKNPPLFDAAYYDMSRVAVEYLTVFNSVFTASGE